MSLIVQYEKKPLAFDPEVQGNIFHLKAMESFAVRAQQEVTIKYGVRIKYDKGYGCYLTASPIIGLSHSTCDVNTRIDPITGEIFSTGKRLLYNTYSICVQCNQANKRVQ